MHSASSASNICTQNLIRQLTQWIKKPSLNVDLSATLDSFTSQMHDEEQMNESLGIGENNINFAEAGLFIQECSAVYVKRVDLLCKTLFQLNCSFHNLLSASKETTIEVGAEISNKPNDQKQMVAENRKSQKEKPVKEGKKAKERKKTEKKKEIPQKETDILTTDVNPVPEVEKEHLFTLTLPNGRTIKFPVKNISEEKIQALKSLNWELGPLEDSIDAFGSDHPLYTIFDCIGSEVDKAKKFFTYNNISLSGLSWNTLYMLEKRLNRSIISSEICAIEGATEKDVNAQLSADVNAQLNNVNVQISVEVTTQFNENVSAQESADDDCADSDFNSEENAESVVNSENNNNVCVISKEVILDLEPLPEKVVQHYMKPDKIPYTIKQLRVNLLRLPISVLKKKSYFKLPWELIHSKPKPERKHNLRKRKQKYSIYLDEAESPTKKSKVVNALTFEEFCYSYFEKEGLVPPRIPELDRNRKSVDARSEMSYGCPVTPDSGHFSMSFLSGDESELADLADHDHHTTHTHPRIDSGLSMTFHDDHMNHTNLPDCQEPTIHSHIDHDYTHHLSDDHTHTDHFADHTEPLPLAVETGHLDTPNSTTDQQNDPTIQTLKGLFPNVFSDPKTVEVVKELIDPLNTEQSENFSQWQKFIDEKTANAQEFNIHEYGTNILNAFPSSTKKDVITFRSVVQDKSIGDIARYFVSTLQLANTYNVSLSEQIPGDVEPDNLQLKFLNKERHHDDFDLTATPSEEYFYDKLSSIQCQEFLQSTPSTSFLKSALRVSSTSKVKSFKRRRIQYQY